MERTLEIILGLFDSSGKTDAELERELNLPKKLIYEWRNGRSKSYKKYYAEIAKYFKVPVGYILGEQKIMAYDEDNNPIAIDHETAEILKSISGDPELEVVFRGVVKNIKSEGFQKLLKAALAVVQEQEKLNKDNQD